VEIYKLLGSMKLEIVLFSMALSKDRKKQRVISRYLTELRNIRPLLKGGDLKRIGIQPGPVYSNILRELLEEKLRGRLKSREDEERFVLSKIK
jgi:tRNA nucleotidyltransferase (CCA-adding enzyme)